MGDIIIRQEVVTHLIAFCGGMLLVAIPIGFAMWRALKKGDDDNVQDVSEEFWTVTNSAERP